MKKFAWKPEKNEWLKKDRGLSFEQIEEAIISGNCRGTMVNHAHPEQIIIAVLIGEYIVCVPATVKSTEIILRTAYHSRKLNKYFGGKKT